MIMTNSYQNDEKLYKLLEQLIHDLRSPLAGLKMWLYGSSSPLIKEERESLEKIYEHMSNNVAGASCEIKKKKVAAVSINLPTLIHDILIQKKVEYMGRDIEILYNTPENSQDINIQGVKDSFFRMLSNLLNNAIEACNDSSGIVRIGLHKINNIITLTINDNGCGMPEDVLQKLRNSEEVTHGKKDGHGVGMGQIRDAINNMNGNLEISSQPGSGSIFTIRFPLV